MKYGFRGLIHRNHVNLWKPYLKEIHKAFSDTLFKSYL